VNQHSNHASGDAKDPPSAPARPDFELPLAGFTGTPEEIDRQWFEKVYAGRGDSMRQLTLRAVLMGGILGMFMSISNLYTTLKVGWSFVVTITACVISFVVWNAICTILRGRVSRMSILENNCMQSVASAAGYSTGSTVGTAIGSLLLITGVHQPWYVVGPFVLFTAALGVFIAIPLKRQMVNYEQLRFPSGVAAAETLQALYSHGKVALQKAYALLATLAVGGVIALLRGYGMVVEALKQAGHGIGWLEKLSKIVLIPEQFAFVSWLAPLSKIQLAGLAFEPSVMMIGAGMITGLRVSLSMLFGSVVLYYFVTPHLYATDLANAGVAGYVPSFAVKGDTLNPIRWALWGGTAVMVFSSLTSLALEWRTVARAFNIFRRKERTARSDALAAIEVPNSWLVAGLVPIGIGTVVVLYLGFHVSVGLGLIAVAVSFLMSLVCCRATGETDTTPVGPMGKVTQLIYAMLPGAKFNAVINLMAAGTTASAGSSAADLLTDLKSGYLLGANPRKQFLAQFIGVFFATLAIVPAWYLMVPTKEVLESFNPPATYMWKAVADLLTQGVNMLPRTALVAIVIGALAGIILPTLAKAFPKLRPWLPSTMGLGLAWVIPFQNSLSFAIGGVIVWAWTKLNAKHSDTYAIPVASGFVAGEALVAAFIAITCTLVGFLAAK
jgi:uncharacterized oligopeptide transporter (OPT) family protein